MKLPRFSFALHVEHVEHHNATMGGVVNPFSPVLRFLGAESANHSFWRLRAPEGMLRACA